MIVLDVETTGTDPSKHSLVSIGAVDFLNPSKQFYSECRIWEGAHVMDEALAVNGFSKEHITSETLPTEAEAVAAFFKWLEGSRIHTIAGLHPSFDMSFVQAAAFRAGIDYQLARRSVDLHSVIYYEMSRRGEEIPAKHGRSNIDSHFIADYVGIPREVDPHNALTGAKWEAEAFSRFFYGKPLFDEFKAYPLAWLQKK